MEISILDYKHRRNFVRSLSFEVEQSLDKVFASREIPQEKVNQVLALLGRIAVPDFTTGQIKEEGIEDETVVPVIPLKKGEVVQIENQALLQTAQQKNVSRDLIAQLSGNSDLTSSIYSELISISPSSEDYELFGSLDGQTRSISKYKRFEMKKGEQKIDLLGILLMRPVILLNYPERNRKSSNMHGALAHELVHYQSYIDTPFRIYQSSRDKAMEDLSEEMEAYHFGAVVEASIENTTLENIMRKASAGDKSFFGNGNNQIFMEYFRRKAAQQSGNNYRPERALLRYRKLEESGFPVLHSAISVDEIFED